MKTCNDYSSGPDPAEPVSGDRYMLEQMGTLQASTTILRFVWGYAALALRKRRDGTLGTCNGFEDTMFPDILCETHADI